MSWSPDYSKALVMIGDEVPHCPSYTTEKINWWDEVDKLVDLGVKIYGVRALHNNHAIPFYEELSERSGAISINFQSFRVLTTLRTTLTHFAVDCGHVPCYMLSRIQS